MAEPKESKSDDYGPSMQSAQEAVGLLFFILFGGGGLLVGYLLSGNAGFVSGALMGVVGLIIGSVIAMTLYLSIIINLEYERAVIYRLGRFARVIGPGLTYKIPYFEWVEKVDTRVTAENVTPQNVMTADSVPVTVDAIVYYRVRKENEEVKKAVLEADDYHELTLRYAQTKLRNMIGANQLDDILHNRKELAKELEQELDETTNDFGVKVRDVELQDIEIPDNMERSMAAEAEAERDRRAKVRKAKGELEASLGVRSAAEILGKNGLQLRTLETLDSIAVDNSTVIPVPLGLGSNLSGGDIDSEGVPDSVQDLINGQLDSMDDADLSMEVSNLLEGETPDAIEEHLDESKTPQDED